MIQTSRPSLGREEIDAIENVFVSGYLGCGDESKEFERRLSDYLTREAVCVSSGTSALHLSLAALGIGAGDEVIVQSLTFLATFQAVAVTGAIPVPCDIVSDDLRLDLADAERKLTGRTKAIIPVHYAGYPGIPDEVYAFAARHHLRVIEDAAHSFGGTCGGRRIGSYGDITCFSFDPVKTLTCGEGGAVVSNDESVLSAVREMRMLGIRKDAEQHGSDPRANVFARGWRYHMNNINAAIGLVQFRKLEETIRKRQMLTSLYRERLKDRKYLEIFPYEYRSIVPYIFVVRLKTSASASVIAAMKLRGIECINHYFPPHQQPFFRGISEVHLKNVEEISPFLLSLPLHTELSSDDIESVVRALDDILGE